MNVFGMVSTKHSVRYTAYAVDSFYRNTPIEQIDRFILIDNDGSLPAEQFSSLPKLELIRNETPLSFAANANLALIRAESSKSDLFFLNNDLIFTPGWLPPLLVKADSLLSPLSNREIQYQLQGLRCARAMELEDYLGRESALTQVVEHHRSRARGYLKVISLPFFCIKLPYSAYSSIGKFDESFGRGGAEDNDYCLRAYLKGFDVAYATSSYVLHFSGKSTWSGAETPSEIEARNSKYKAVFNQKWGTALLQLVIEHNDQIISTSAELLQLAKAGDFKALINHLAVPSHTTP